MREPCSWAAGEAPEEVSARIARLAWNPSSAACREATGVVLVPTIPKGLNNFRLRLVQDIAASVLARAAVALPVYVASRRNCGYDAHCYQDYAPSVRLWRVFDRNATLAALDAAGVCAIDGHPVAVTLASRPFRSLQQTPRWFEHTSCHLPVLAPEATAVNMPIAASVLEERWRAGTIRAPPSRLGLREQVALWSWSRAHMCCTLLIPDTQRSLRLVRQVNSALVTLADTQALADSAEAAIAPAAAAPGAYVSVHWRGESDFTGSQHALSVQKYTQAMAVAFGRAVESCGAACGSPARVLVLGVGWDGPALAGLRSRLLNASVESAPRSLLHHPSVQGAAFYSKETLLARAAPGWAASFGGFDDAVGQLDFELGVRSARFVGTGFSSFSLAIYLARTARSVPSASSLPGAYGDSIYNGAWAAAAHGGASEMADVDVSDRLGAIFRIHLTPEDGRNTRAEAVDPCKALLKAHPRFRELDRPRLGACPRVPFVLGQNHPAASARPPDRCDTLAPRFRFEPALDHPERHGHDCTLSAFTAIMGGYYDRAPVYDGERMLRFRGPRLSPDPPPIARR